MMVLLKVLACYVRLLYWSTKESIYKSIYLNKASTILYASIATSEINLLHVWCRINWIQKISMAIEFESRWKFRNPSYTKLKGIIYIVFLS